MKIKDFFWKWGEVQRQKGSSVCRKLPWMEKWRRVLHRQCYFFSLLSFSAEWQIFYFSRWPVCCLAAWPGEDIGKRWESRVTWSLHDVTVCGTKVQVKRCRGTCRSISRITMGFPYYRKYCQSRQGNKFTDKTVSCAGGGHKKIRYPAGWSCEDCLA